MASDNVRAVSRVSDSLRILCVFGAVGVVLSAIQHAPSEPLANGIVSVGALLHVFAATLCMSLGLLSSRGSNVVANHGGIGILAGLCIGCIFEAQLKAGAIFFLFGAFPGIVFGVVIGKIRSMAKSLGDSPDVSGEGRDERPAETDDLPT